MEKRKKKDTALMSKNQSLKDDMEIDLIELFYRLLEKAKYIVFSALFCAAVALALTIFLIAPRYTSTSKLYIANAKDSAIDLSDLQLGTYLASDYKEIFSNHIIHERVIKNLGLDYSVGELSGMVGVYNPDDTRLLYISATSESARESMEIANEYASVVREFIADRMDADTPNIFEDAVLPTDPTSPSKKRNTFVGFFIGLLIPCVIITISFLKDDKIRTSEDIQKYIDLPTLGMLPSVSEKMLRKNDQNPKRRRDKGGRKQ